MTIIRSLGGWIAFAIVGAFAGNLWSAGAALLVSLISLAIGLRANSGRLAPLVLELSTAVFFAGLTVLVLIDPGAPIDRWGNAASYLWLGATATLTLLIHQPFTLAIAKTRAPQQIWDSPQFHAFNVTITRGWTISFWVAGAILLALAAADRTHGAVTVVIAVLAIVLPLVWMNRKIAAAQQQGVA